MAVYEPREIAGGGWRLALPQPGADYVTLAALDPELDHGALRATLVVLRGETIVTKDRTNLTRAQSRKAFADALATNHGVTVEEAALLALEAACRRTATVRHGTDRELSHNDSGNEATTGEEDLADDAELPPAVDVPLDDLLHLIVALLITYLVFRSPLQATALALWIAHTHTIAAFDVTPYLHVQSPQPRSGKTRLLELVEELVLRPWRVVDVTAATVFRKIARDAPTLLLDEVDAIWRPKQSSDTAQALRGVLNAGYRRGAVVPRCFGKDYEKQVDFPVFSAKALAGIGRLPDTIADRAVCLVLARKKKTERTARFRFRTVKQEAAVLRRGLARWAAGAIDALRAARPSIPDTLDDRAMEIWEPLLAIADLAGGSWPAEARRAAVALHGAVGEDDSVGIILLRAIKELFTHRDSPPFLLTLELLIALVEREAEPWGTWWGADVEKALEKDRHPQGPANKLASLLKPFDITSQDIRTPDGTRRGYLRAAFADAWERYVPDSPPGGCDGATTVAAQGFPASHPTPDPDGGATAETLGREGLSHRRASDDGEGPFETHSAPSDVAEVTIGNVPSLSGATVLLCAACGGDRWRVNGAEDSESCVTCGAVSPLSAPSREPGAEG
jgi:hypothetical protein